MASPRKSKKKKHSIKSTPKVVTVPTYRRRWYTWPLMFWRTLMIVPLFLCVVMLSFIVLITFGWDTAKATFNGLQGRAN